MEDVSPKVRVIAFLVVIALATTVGLLFRTDEKGDPATGTTGDPAAELWQAVRSGDNESGYAEYLEKYPDGEHAPEARRRLAEFTAERRRFAEYERVWEEARAAGTEAALRRFIRENPDNPNANSARLVLAERQERRALANARTGDVATLVADGAIRASVTGSGISSVDLELRLAGNRAARVKIPAGTLFAARNSRVQNMVTVKDQTVEVLERGGHTVQVEVACANRTREIPGVKDRFRVTSATNHPELTAVARRLGDEDFDVRQAAIWIVSDDATLSELQALRSGQGGTIIQPREARRAMKIVQRAGVDITQKRIWRDRHRVRF